VLCRNWYLYHPGKKAIEICYANRWDAVIISVSFVLYIYAFVSVGFKFYFNDNEDGLRFVMALPLLRVFALIGRIRRLVFTLILLLPEFVSIVVVLLVVFFIFGVWGVLLMANVRHTRGAEEEEKRGRENTNEQREGH